MASSIATDQRGSLYSFKSSVCVCVCVCLCVVCWGSYFDHALAWEKRMNDPNVMIITYEELKQVTHTHKYTHTFCL